MSSPEIIPGVGTFKREQPAREQHITLPHLVWVRAYSGGGTEEPMSRADNQRRCSRNGVGSPLPAVQLCSRLDIPIEVLKTPSLTRQLKYHTPLLFNGDTDPPCHEPIAEGSSRRILTIPASISNAVYLH